MKFLLICCLLLLLCLIIKDVGMEAKTWKLTYIFTCILAGAMKLSAQALQLNIIQPKNS